MRKFHIISILVFALVLAVACKKKDQTPPEVSLLGEPVVVVPLNGSWDDPGARGSDAAGGTVVITVSGVANTQFAGVYNIFYTAWDESGNSSDVLRTVVVRNDSDSLNGNFSALSISGTDSLGFYAYTSTSNLTNRRLWIGGFGWQPSAAVYADVLHDTLIIPSQRVEAGNPPTEHNFEGRGMWQYAGDTLVMTIHYSDSVSGTLTNGVTVYRKIP